MTKRTGTRAEVEAAAEAMYLNGLERAGIKDALPWADLNAKYPERAEEYRLACRAALGGLFKHQAAATKET